MYTYSSSDTGLGYKELCLLESIVYLDSDLRSLGRKRSCSAGIVQGLFSVNVDFGEWS